jgi:hypothetical protein
MVLEAPPRRPCTRCTQQPPCGTTGTALRQLKTLTEHTQQRNCVISGATISRHRGVIRARSASPTAASTEVRPLQKPIWTAVTTTRAHVNHKDSRATSPEADQTASQFRVPHRKVLLYEHVWKKPSLQPAEEDVLATPVLLMQTASQAPNPCGKVLLFEHVWKKPKSSATTLVPDRYGPCRLGPCTTRSHSSGSHTRAHLHTRRTGLWTLRKPYENKVYTSASISVGTTRK